MMMKSTSTGTEADRKELYTQTSRYRHWNYSRGKGLKEKREEVNNDGIARAIKAMKEEKEALLEVGNASNVSLHPDQPAVLQESDFLTWEEQVLLCRIYESKIANYCKFFKFDDMVLSTSVAFFKRFYLLNTLMDYDPKVILLTCLFLAAKVENSYIPLADFLHKVPKAPPAETILELEFVVSEGLRFEFMIPHLKWPLHGLFLDMQTYLSTVYPNKESFLNRLVETYKRAREFTTLSLYTDLSFTHMPSQIAMGCMLMASKECSFHDDMRKYISFRITWVTAESMVDLHTALQEVEDAVKAQISWKAPIEEGKRIDLKLQSCRNPEFIAESAFGGASTMASADNLALRDRANSAMESTSELQSSSFELNDAVSDMNVLGSSRSKSQLPQQKAAMVSRRGSFIVLGDSLRSAAEAVTKKSLMERMKIEGDDYKPQVALTSVHIDEQGQTILEAPTLIVGDVNPFEGFAEDLEEARATGGWLESKSPARSRAGSMARIAQSYQRADSHIENLNFFQDYLKTRLVNLNSDRILLLEKESEIRREKRRKMDLKEKERIGSRILDLERDISEKVLETQKTFSERRQHEIELDNVKAQHQMVNMDI
ncbi:hypothetical protein HDU76_000237 [Blyttiomyces sp. JEL0837]|nr:hypothetical protein HDU76_000237 [Blyttiomyces sp. JEL0837]